MKKKNKTATVKNIRVKKKHIKKTAIEKQNQKRKKKCKKKNEKKLNKKTKQKTKKNCPKKKKTLSTVNFLRVLVYYLITSPFIFHFFWA